FADAIVQGQKIVIRTGISIAPGFVDEEEHSACERFSVGNHHSAFAGGHVLALLHAETANGAKSSNVFSAGASQICLSTILNHRDISRPRQIHDSAHFTGMAEQMGHDDSFRTLAQATLEGLARYVQR